MALMGFDIIKTVSLYPIFTAIISKEIQNFNCFSGSDPVAVSTHLKPPRVDLHDPGELAQPQDFPVGEVANADLVMLKVK